MVRKYEDKRSTKRTCGIVIAGLLLMLLAILGGIFLEDCIHFILSKQLVLRPNSTVYDNWKKPPLHLSLDIYLFNWTNPEELHNSSNKPILEQLGPYRFTEQPDKVDIHWHPHNDSITYRKKSDFYFDAAGSQGSLDDMVTTLNAVALSAAGKAKHWNNLRRNMVDVGLKLYNQQMSVKHTVDELLFTGYSEDMIDMARTFPLFGDDVEVPFDRFGWFYTRNGSADLTGVFNVYTGANDISKLGQMHSWNYNSHTGFFDAYCGMTNGSAGEFHSPNLQKFGSISFFTPDMCRSIPLDYVEQIEVEGVVGYKYAGGQRSVDNGTLYPENLCFCGGECVPSGVMNISSCRFSSPVFMSFPHFYNADPYYTEQVEGMQPEKAKHEFYMILEPTTGIALEVAARFQVNMMVEPIEGIGLYQDIPRVYLPVIWFEQKVRISPQLAADLKLLPTTLLVVKIICAVLFAVGVLLICWLPLQKYCCIRKSMPESNLPHLKPDLGDEMEKNTPLLSKKR